MVETKSKVWLQNNKHNIVEATFIGDSVALDVYVTKKELVKHHLKILWHILFVKKPVVADKNELALTINSLIDDYYDDENMSNMLKQKTLEELELVDKNTTNISYIG